MKRIDNNHERIRNLQDIVNKNFVILYNLYQHIYSVCNRNVVDSTCLTSFYATESVNNDSKVESANHKKRSAVNVLDYDYVEIFTGEVY